MKMLQSMTDHIDQWRRAASANTSNKPIGQTWRMQQRRLRRFLLKELSALLSAGNPARSQHLRCGCVVRTHSRCRKANRPQVVFVLAVVSLTSTLGHRFYNQPKLDVGIVAPQTIRAPRDAAVVDTKTTEAKQKAARRGLVPVLMVDPVANEHIYQELQASLARIDELRPILSSFPFTNTSVLSIATQLYLRDCPEWEWRMVLASQDAEAMGEGGGKTGSLGDEVQFSPPPLPAPLSSSPQLQRAVVELQAYRRSSSSQNLSVLLNQISQTRQNYQKALSSLQKECKSENSQFLFSGKNNTPIYISAAVQSAALNIPDCGYASLLRSSQADWQTTLTGIRKAADRILTQGIPAGLPMEQLQEAVRVQIKNQVPETLQTPATELLLAVLQPNLKENAEQTRLLAEKAAQAVEPEIIEIRQGEVIVQAGETIDQADFLLLDHFGLSRRGLNWLGLIGFGGIISGTLVVFWLVQRRFHHILRRRDYILVLLLTLSTPLLVSLGIPYTSLPAIGLLVGSFYGSALGATAVGLLSFVLPISVEIGWEHLLAGAAGGILGGIMAGRMRSREELALLGIAVGLTEGVVYLLVNLIVGGPATLLWYALLRESGIYSLTGLAWSVVALGLTPYLEHLFDLVTPVRLAELANPSRPLLKRLAEEAPGTFQHTLLVASLAEAAAKALGCNVELVRTGTLYHDIGKLHDPQAFIENQMGQPNKHDEINNPWTSAEIIKKHVTEGIVMARKHRLPKAIEAFIPEHQGTMLIAYFYHKAQQNPTQPVRDEDFRYDGPIPQSRETALLMLADGCEAALRSLKEATYEEALVMVNKILKARWQEGQLAESGLTREEMPQIAEVFVQVWQQFHHKRIAYPKIGVKA